MENKDWGSERFWTAVVLVIAAVGYGFRFLPAHRFGYSIGHHVWAVFLMSVLAAVVWAICFRPQVQRLQIGLKPLFVLLAMEAILLVAYRITMEAWLGGNRH